MANRRTAVITGASQGIGRAIAERFLSDGYNLVAVDRSPDGIAELAEGRDDVASLTTDVTSKSAPFVAVSLAEERFGRLDVLVNNAGIARARSLLDTPDEDLDRYVAVNLNAPFRFSREAIRIMGAGAAIVHISSIYGLLGYPNVAPYAATKAAILGLTRQMAADYGPQGIRVNAVAPGLVRTPLNTDRIDSDPVFRQMQIERTPFTRIGRPSDIASAVAFLCSEEAGFINGQVLAVDGGWSAAHQVVEGRIELH